MNRQQQVKGGKEWGEKKNTALEIHNKFSETQYLMSNNNNHSDICLAVL